QGVRGRHPRRHLQRVGRDARRAHLRRHRVDDHRAARLGVHPDPFLHPRDRRARDPAQWPVRPRGGEESMKTVVLAAAFLAALAFTATANSYYVFIMATLALTAVVGIGLN